MVKKIFLGILFFLIGVAAWMLLFKNQPLPESVITIGKKESNFEPTQFSLENAPNESIRGEITQMDGEIWWQSRTATEPAKIITPMPIQQGETLIASDAGKLTVKFNPVVTISLFPASKLEIVQTLPLNLVFKHTLGVGQYLVTGKAPVSIRSLNLIANINEGLFVIDTDPVTGIIILSLKTGIAKVGYNSPEFDSKVWDLSPGDVFEYDSQSRTGYFK